MHPPLTARRLAVLLALLPACLSSGPAGIERSRGDYNLAVQRTEDEQLLLNVVRLRYRDTPYFLQLSSISATLVREVEAAVSGDLVEAGPGGLALGGTITVADEPTITYTPLQGNDFVRQMLTPIDLRTLSLLYNSGWAIDRVLRLCAQSLNGLSNAPSASGPTPSRAPRFDRFLECVRLLRQLQVEGQLHLGQVMGEAGPELRVRILPEGRRSAAATRLRELLGLPADRDVFPIVNGTAAGESGTIAVLPRSLMGCLFYASQAVEAPRADRERGRVTVTLDAGGDEFDWNELFAGLLQVRSAGRRPAGASVAVRYRDAWFYIADDDLDSKTTFALLNQIFALQSGEVESRAPMLTLPVGR